MYHFKWAPLLAAAALTPHSWDLTAVTGFHLEWYGSQLELAPEFAKPQKETKRLANTNRNAFKYSV